MKKTGGKGVRKKTFFILIACVCLIAIVAEGLLLAGVFSGKKNKSKNKADNTVTPEGTVLTPTGEAPSPAPDREQTVRVWRETERTMDRGAGSYPLEKQEYDEAGRRVHSVLYLNGETVQQETFFTYDGAGRLVRTEQRTADLSSSAVDAMHVTTEHRTYYDNGDLKSVEITPPEFDMANASLTEYTYDGNHHVLTETRYLGRTKSLVSRTDYEYNEAGKLIRYGKTDANNISLWSEEHEYDAQGRLIRTSGGEKPGVTESTTTYSYDNAGQLISELYVSEDAKGANYSVQHSYEYDKEGNLIRKKEEGSSNVSSSSNYVFTYEYAYDGNGNMTRETQYYTDGAVLYDHLYEYDENDVLKKEIQKNPDGSVSATVSYQYQAFDVPREDLTKQDLERIERRTGR